MTQQQWEYCTLGIQNAKVYDQKRGLWVYNSWIEYVGVNGESIRQVLAPKPLPFNPWTRACGLLGGAGWEMVTVQHGNAYGGSFGSYENAIISQEKVAYFKRLVLPGRAIDEPKLIF